MTLDATMLCPGGRQQQVRDCSTCRTFLGDLAKIQKSIEGNQHASARQQVDRLCEKYPDRPCLISLQAQLALEQKDLDSVKQAIDRGLDLEPENPLFLSLGALMGAFVSRTADGIPLLQDALDQITVAIPETAAFAAQALAMELIHENKYEAARAHAFLKSQLDGTISESDPQQNLARRFDQFEAPAILKSLRLLPFDGDPKWGDRFEEAVEMAGHGCWLAALGVFEAIDEEMPDCPSVVYNIADMHSRLAHDEAAAAWRRFARLPGTSLDDAIEAEAHAVLVDPENRRQAKRIERRYPVSQLDRVMELLLSNPRIQQIDASVEVEEGAPQPKAVFLVLDRPLDPDPAARRPAVIAMALVFGKQTDQEAYVSVSGEPEVVPSQWVAELLGDLICDEATELVGEDQSALDLGVMFDDRTLTSGLSPLETEKVTRDNLEAELFEAWPQRPSRLLDGRPPAEVADDPEYRNRLAGLILAIEQSLPAPCADLEMDVLRDRIGLPRTEPLEFDESVPLNRFWRVRLDGLLDDDLVKVFVVCRSMSMWLGCFRAALAVAGRESLEKELDSVYRGLASLPGPRHRLLEFIDIAREATVARGKSPAQWLLAELPLRMAVKDAERANELWVKIQSHVDEPGVNEQLFSLMVEMGMITPEGQMTKQMEAAVQQQEPAAPQPESRIWTPDQQDPAAGGKSKLWVPD